MLSKTLVALAGTALCVAALPSGSYGGHDDYGLGDGIVNVANYDQKVAEEEISLKEICYRNLYADVAAFDLRTDKEVAIKDAGNSDVFLFASTKKDIDDKEFYYEEFCYKQTLQKEHNSKVSADSVLVGLKEKRDGGIGGGLGSGIGGGLGSGIGGGLGSGIGGGLGSGVGGLGSGVGGGLSSGIGGGLSSGLGAVGGFDGLGSLDSGSFLSGGWGDDSIGGGLGSGLGSSSSFTSGGGLDGGLGGGIH